MAVVIAFGKAAIDRSMLDTAAAASKQAECDAEQLKRFGSVGPHNKQKEPVQFTVSTPSGRTVVVEGPPGSEDEALAFAKRSLQENAFADLIPNWRSSSPYEAAFQSSSGRAFRFVPQSEADSPTSPPRLFSRMGICAEAESLSLNIATQKAEINYVVEKTLVWALLIGFLGSVPAATAFSWRFLLVRLREISDAIRGK
ncbi:MAG: hypothetical protein ACK5XE_00275 [Burkholderiales bacterium]